MLIHFSFIIITTTTIIIITPHNMENINLYLQTYATYGYK